MDKAGETCVTSASIIGGDATGRGNENPWMIHWMRLTGPSVMQLDLMNWYTSLIPANRPGIFQPWISSPSVALLAQSHRDRIIDSMCSIASSLIQLCNMNWLTRWPRLARSHTLTHTHTHTHTHIHVLTLQSSPLSQDFLQNPISNCNQPTNRRQVTQSLSFYNITLIKKQSRGSPTWSSPPPPPPLPTGSLFQAMKKDTERCKDNEERFLRVSRDERMEWSQCQPLESDPNAKPLQIEFQ